MPVWRADALSCDSLKPSVARVHGAAFAGGMGLVTACDIAVASTEAKFCLSEVKLGLVPGMISPYVIRAMGERAARPYFLRAEVIDAAEAHRIGLVHELVEPAQLDARVDALLGHLVQGSPNALGETNAPVDLVWIRDSDPTMTGSIRQIDPTSKSLSPTPLSPRRSERAS